MSRLKTFSLEESPHRVSNRVVALDDASEWASHLRRIGFHEGVEVEVLSGRDPVMVRCQNGCVALRRCMLGCVQVCALQEAQQRAIRSAR
jgi:Fe2+ transport system protein FeoA